MLKTPKKSIKIKWQSQHDQKILFYVLIAIKTITATHKILSINYGFQTNNVSISISLGFQQFSENSLSACVKHNKL